MLMFIMETGETRKVWKLGIFFEKAKLLVGPEEELLKR